MLGEPIEIRAYERYASSVRYAPDPRSQLAVSAGGTGLLRLWMVPTWQPARMLTGHRHAVNGLVISSDGRQVVSGSTDGTLRVWSLVPPERELAVFEGHKKTVAGVALSPDDRLLASASYDATVRLWDLESHEELLRFKPGKRNMTAVAFSLDGKKLLGGGLGEELYVWDVASGDESARLGGHEQAVSSLTFTPEFGQVPGQLLVADTASVALRSFPGLEELWRWQSPQKGVFPTAASPDGRLLAVGGDHHLWLLEAESGELLHEVKLGPKGVYSVDFAPDMSHVAVATSDGALRVFPLIYTVLRGLPL